MNKCHRWMNSPESVDLVLSPTGLIVLRLDVIINRQLIRVVSCHFPIINHGRDKWIHAVKMISISKSGQPLDILWIPDDHHKLCTCHSTNQPNSKHRRQGGNHVYYLELKLLWNVRQDQLIETKIVFKRKRSMRAAQQ